MRLDIPPEQSEEVSRFIFSKRWFATNPKRRVKSDAFLPESPKPPDVPEWETSISRGADLDHKGRLQIGEEIQRKRGKALKAWADVRAGAIYQVGLKVRLDDKPSRHACIVGWAETDKDARMSAAQGIADASSLILPGDSLGS